MAAQLSFADRLVMAVAERSRMPGVEEEMYAAYDLIEPYGHVLMVDIWRRIVKYDVMSVHRWLQYHGQTLPVDIWLEFTDAPYSVLANYPWTRADLEVYEQHYTVDMQESLAHNEHLQLCAVQYLRDTKKYVLHPRIYDQWWEVLQPRALEVQMSMWNVPHYDFSFELFERYYGLDNWDMLATVGCESKYLSVDYILSRAHEVRWDECSFRQRGDYSLAQWQQFCELRHISSVGEYYNHSLGERCRDEIDSLCQFKLHLGGEKIGLCYALMNSNHDFLTAYRHVCECHPEEVELALSWSHRTITFAEYEAVRQNSAAHAESCRQLVRPGIDRLWANPDIIERIITIEYLEQVTADVFALIVFMCDDLIAL